jgi:threonine synthase
MAPFVGDSLSYERLLELTTAAYGRFRMLPSRR